MDKHKTVRNHIAAAKGWLSQAEKSLEQENDIRGDLNLMLAQAELQSAQEKQPQKAWLVWGRRLLPLAAALCVAAGYVAYLRPVPEVPAMPPAALEKVADNGREGADLPVEPVPDYPQHKQSLVPVASEAIEASGFQEAAVPVREAVMPLTAGENEASEVMQMAGQVEGPAGRQAGVPGIEVQKLMQEAGNVLRE